MRDETSQISNVISEACFFWDIFVFFVNRKAQTETGALVGSVMCMNLSTDIAVRLQLVTKTEHEFESCIKWHIALPKCQVFVSAYLKRLFWNQNGGLPWCNRDSCEYKQDVRKDEIQEENVACTSEATVGSNGPENSSVSNEAHTEECTIHDSEERLHVKVSKIRIRSWVLPFDVRNLFLFLVIKSPLPYSIGGSWSILVPNRCCFHPLN